MNNPNLDKALNKMALSHETNSREEEYLRTKLTERLAMPIRATVSRSYYTNHVIGKINKHYPDNEFYITTDLLLKLFHTRLKENSEPISWRSSDFLDSLYAVITDKKVTSRLQFFKENQLVFLLWYGDNLNGVAGKNSMPNQSVQKTEGVQVRANVVIAPPTIGLVNSLFEENLPSEATPNTKNDKVKPLNSRSRMVSAFITVGILFSFLFLKTCSEKVQYRVFLAALDCKDSVWCASKMTFSINPNKTIDVAYKGMSKESPEFTFTGTAFDGQKAVQVSLINHEVGESGSFLINKDQLNHDWWKCDTLLGVYMGISRNGEPNVYKAILVKEADNKTAQVNDFIREYINTPDKYGIASRLFEGGLPR